MSRWGLWCKNGCGKKVVYVGSRYVEFRFKCQYCGEKYRSKEEVLNVL